MNPCAAPCPASAVSSASRSPPPSERRNAAPPNSRFRPTLERCEDREVPANLDWTNLTGDGLFETAANWRDLDTRLTATAAPTVGDGLTFDGTLTNTTLANLHGFGLPDSSADFASISLVNGYAGTVTFAPDGSLGLSATTFTLNSGAIAQPVANTDLSVLGTFTWTGGTLNNSANTATVNVLGDGNISPLNAGTVSLGSTLIFTGTQPAPKETTINPGTIQVTSAAANIIVGAYATLTARTVTVGDIIGITKNQAGAQAVQILANGALGCYGPGTYNNDLPVANGGKFVLRWSARANLTAGDATHLGYAQGTGSELHLENGSVLTVPHRLSIEGGLIALEMNPNLPADQQTATISGSIVMSGGLILFSPPIQIGTIPLVYGTFTVNGNVNWTGGTYKPSVDYTTAGLANKWIINGTLTSAQACIVEPNPQRGQNPPPASNWVILDATVTAGQLPTVAPGSPLSLGSFVVGDRTVWKLTSN